ncbi:hypothetical protein Tco_0825544 [Tanacetum coccineum]
MVQNYCGLVRDSRSWAEDGEAGVGWATVGDCWAAGLAGCCWCGNGSVCPIVGVVRVGFETVRCRSKVKTMIPSMRRGISQKEWRVLHVVQVFEMDKGMQYPHAQHLLDMEVARGKRVAKRATVNLVDEDEEKEEHIRQCARWTRDEEVLLTECWIETSENGQIEADRTDDLFWGQIMDDFNTATTQGYRTEHMLMGKWSRINGDCQKFNAIYKHLERISGENGVDHIEAAKVTFAA